MSVKKRETQPPHHIFFPIFSCYFSCTMSNTKRAFHLPNVHYRLESPSFRFLADHTEKFAKFVYILLCKYSHPHTELQTLGWEILSTH